MAVSPPVVPSKDQIMGELREVTIQYTSCADPTESAARKQRVIQGEAKNLMSNTANKILQAATISTPSTPYTAPKELFKAISTLEDRVAISKEILPAERLTGKTTKRGRGRPPLARSSAKPPPRLLGAKNQKRNITHGSPKKILTQRQIALKSGNQAGSSTTKPSQEKKANQDEG